MGAWIEIVVDCDYYRCAESLPSRERGLKYIFHEFRARNAFVAPFAGAWIEILVLYLLYYAKWSLPSRNDGDSRTTILPPNLAPVPHPYNLSPTPTKTFAHVMTHVL